MTQLFKTKKIALILLIVLLILSYFSLPVFAEDSGACGKNLSWELVGSTLVISGEGDMENYYDGSFAPWYPLRNKISAVVLPEKLTSVGSFAFYGAEKLSSVNLPSSVKKIGAYAFAECSALISVRFSSSLEEIGESAFSFCSSLSAAYLPSSLKKIATKAFYRCSSLIAVIVPASVSEMGSSVFAYCTSLVRATVSSSFSELPVWTFYGCSSLTAVSLSPSIVSTGDSAFEGCEKINYIFTETHDPEIAADLDEDIRKNNENISEGAYVDTGTMPGSSTSSSDDGEKTSQTTVTETENSEISVIKRNDGNKSEIEISANVKNDNGWQDIKDTVDNVRNDGFTEKIDVTVTLPSSEISGDDLGKLGGEKLTLTVKAEDGSEWKIDMEHSDKKDFSGKYTLGALLSDSDAETSGVSGQQIYKVSFGGSTDFNTTVGIKVGNKRQYATLFQGKDAVQTVLIDDDGIAWFKLAAADDKTDYYIGINSDGADFTNAVIPDSLSDIYGVDSTLTDENGTQYKLTGRTSRWGITGGQFAIYVAVAVGALVLIVSLIMITLNKIAKSKAKYAAAAGPSEDIDREALRLEVLRETSEKSGENKETEKRSDK